MLTWLTILTTCLAAQADDAIERTVPELLTAPNAWYVAECTNEPDTTHARPGGDGTVRHWHVPVDFHAGEKNYPVGWPRTGCASKESLDWSGYDFFEFWTYAESSRQDLPHTPFVVIFSTPDRSHQLVRTVPAKLGEWVHTVIPMEDLVDPTILTRVQWSVSESSYQDGDVLDFYLADIALGRYTRPSLLEFKPLESLVASRGRYLPCDLHLVGVPEGQEVAATVLLRRDGKALAETQVKLTRGRKRVILPLPDKLPPGQAELALQFDAGQDAATAPLRIVTGPFDQEDR